ncbi:MAG: CDGSH iron-sulfur domain-containing protein [Dehalococcoidia bacterium]
MADVKIEVRANGPLRVYGPIDLVDADGNPYSIPEGQWVSMCRCGQSGNKPFCDTSHRDAGFEAESKAS